MSQNQAAVLEPYARRAKLGMLARNRCAEQGRIDPAASLIGACPSGSLFPDAYPVSYTWGLPFWGIRLMMF
jgi:hypothetical protein